MLTERNGKTGRLHGGQLARMGMYLRETGVSPVSSAREWERYLSWLQQRYPDEAAAEAHTAEKLPGVLTSAEACDIAKG